MQELFSALSLWLSAHPLITGWYTAIARLLFPVLSALILVRAIRSLLRIPHTPEVWAQLSLPGGGSIPLTHWENILGRGKIRRCDSELPQHLPAARGLVPGRRRCVDGLRSGLQGGHRRQRDPL